MNPTISLRHAQSIVDHDVIGERWRQLKTNGVENRDDDQWADRLGVCLDDAYFGMGAERVRQAVVTLAATAVAWIEDIDRRQLSRVQDPLPDLALSGEVPLFVDQMKAGVA